MTPSLGAFWALCWVLPGPFTLGPASLPAVSARTCSSTSRWPCSYLLTRLSPPLCLLCPTLHCSLGLPPAPTDPRQLLCPQSTGSVTCRLLTPLWSPSYCFGLWGALVLPVSLSDQKQELCLGAPLASGTMLGTRGVGVRSVTQVPTGDSPW